jgi:hypothetical protein
LQYGSLRDLEDGVGQTAPVLGELSKNNITLPAPIVLKQNINTSEILIKENRYLQCH